MGQIVLDTDVVIEHIKGNTETQGRLLDMGLENICLSAITIMELFFGALNKRELSQLKKRLRAFPVLHVNDDVSRNAVDLIENYSKSHQLEIPDALIAATAITNQLPLFTYNQKDFRYIPGLILV
jgi:hypothetical protein